MTKEEAKENAAILLAYAEGKEIQWRLSSTDIWLDYDLNELTFQFSSYFYRIKPIQPIYRPWKLEEVPVGGLFKSKDNTFKGILTGVLFDTYPLIYFVTGGHTLSSLLKDWEHSLDYGKTWQPCGVLE